ncbi:MAG: FAD-dependent oxidoreductase [Burkholderiaceae bacterium]|jgi:succinate dehydrogenase/fumarate reductase flavoprotein subunit|nr:FAD-dependent oxidoreductase [Burkholderiaceae bacterium]
MAAPINNNPQRRRLLRGMTAGAAALAASSATQASLLPKPKKSEKVDVVVIGAGMSGLTAALTALQAGAKVLIVDKMPESRTGGNSRLAGGLFAVPRDDSAEAKKDYLEDFAKKAMGRGNVEIYKVLAERAHESVAWVKAQGGEFLPLAPLAPYRLSQFTPAPAPYFGMPRLLAALRAKFTASGGRIAFDTKARQLLMDESGRVNGVRATNSDGAIDYLAGAVVIAAGGYAAARDMLETLIDPNAGAMNVRGVKTATGDGQLLAREAGAALIGMAGLTALHIAAVAPSDPAAGNPFLALPFGVAINRQGRRFVDESRGYVAVGKATMGQPEQTIALVLSEEAFNLPAPQLSAATFRKLNQTIVEAASAEEMAAKLDVPVASFVATVNEFNARVEAGNKAPGATPPKNGFAYKLSGKLYAFTPLKPGITLTFGGIAINPRAQALESDGRVVRGLFACGEGAGALYFDDYIGGGSLINCLVMGRVAGASAAAAAKDA